MKYLEASRPAMAEAEYWLSQEEPAVALPGGPGEFSDTPGAFRAGLHNGA